MSTYLKIIRRICLLQSIEDFFFSEIGIFHHPLFSVLLLYRFFLQDSRIEGVLLDHFACFDWFDLHHFSSALLGHHYLLGSAQKSEVHAAAITDTPHFVDPASVVLNQTKKQSAT